MITLLLILALIQASKVTTLIQEQNFIFIHQKTQRTGKKNTSQIFYMVGVKHRL